MTSLTIWLRCAVALLIVIASSTALAAENVWSVEYLNSRKAEWDQLIGPTVRIEGRITLHGRGQMRLSKCDLAFHVKDAQLRPLNGKRTVELAGRFKKEDGKLFFEVEQIQAAPTDVEQFDSRSAKFRNPRPAEWYELGDWASSRSRFYEDTDLAKKALSAYGQGIKVEMRSLSAGDADARFELARKVQQYKLADDVRFELLHEGYRLLWQAALKSEKTSAEDWKELAAHVADDLPGSVQPLPRFSPTLKDRYEREALTVYRESPDDVRRQLHRMLYVMVILKPILLDAALDGRNGDSIADQIERHAPEEKALAEKYLDMNLTWKLSRVSAATRPEVEQLATALRSRQQPDRATQALKTWLQARETRLRDDGPLGLLQLADEYLALLRDEPKAVSLLKEAHQLDPSFADVSQRLQSLGYNWDGRNWMKEQIAKPKNDSDKPKPFAPSGISVGMTASALRTFQGRPESIGRAVTAKGVVEVWCYGAVGASRLIVRLERSSGATEARVVEVR